MLELTLPYPPSVNHMYRHSRRGVFLTPEVKQYRSLVRLMLRGAKVEPVAGDVVLEIYLHPPDRRKRDCDNAIKQVQDALQAEKHRGIVVSRHHAFEDDSQVKRLIVEKREPVPGGKIIVRITEYDARVETLPG